jgi:hypothetical protein
MVEIIFASLVAGDAPTMVSMINRSCFANQAAAQRRDVALCH